MADLSQVFEQEHFGSSAVVSGRGGVFVGRTFTTEQSGNVAEVRLNRDDTSFDIEFQNGQRYRYLDVPVEVMETCEHAPSIGSWINRTLKGKFRYYHLNGD